LPCPRDEIHMRCCGLPMDREEKATARQLFAIHHLEGLSLDNSDSDIERNERFILFTLSTTSCSWTFTRGQAHPISFVVTKQDIPRAFWILPVDVFPSKHGSSQYCTMNQFREIYRPSRTTFMLLNSLYTTSMVCATVIRDSSMVSRSNR
jgi:hypothetical protein